MMDDAPGDVLVFPVRVCDGRIVVVDDVTLPEGASGEVRFVGAQLAAPLSSSAMSRAQLAAPLHEAGTELRFLVRADRVPPPLLTHTLPCSENEIYTDAGRRKTPRLFVSATLTQPLHRQRLVTGHEVLRGGACRIECLNVTARSLHHAYTLISEAFEPHRLSHDGNAWDKAHALHEGKWLPLRRLCAPDAPTISKTQPSTPRARGSRSVRARRDIKTGSLF